MSEQLAFAIVTPYTIRKSRTGAVLSRLLGRVSADLIATQMFSPTREFAETYAASLPPAPEPENEPYRELIRSYIRESIAPDSSGKRRRVLMLVFRGENAFHDVSRVIGRLRISCTTGESIRDTYGDLVTNEDGTVRYFEPAVLTCGGEKQVPEMLRLWADFAKSSPGLLEDVCVYENPDRVQQTLVLIKPDSWRRRSSRPGTIIDMFSRTGLRIIGCKLCQISVTQALEFYGPVRELLSHKLAPGIGVRARQILERELGCTLSQEVEQQLAATVGTQYAQDQFARIIEFMTGLRPEKCPPEERDAAGKTSCLALAYEGVDAVQQIRDVLGPTDPTKAPIGTVRREFGSDVMVNTAHASDSPDNARREMGILKIRESNFVSVVNAALEECYPDA